MTDVAAQARERAQQLISVAASVRSTGSSYSDPCEDLARNVVALADAVDAYKDQLGKVVADRAEYRARAEKAEQENASLRDALRATQQERDAAEHEQEREFLACERQAFRAEAAERRVVDLEAALRQAREDIVAVAAAHWDSHRKAVGHSALGRISAVMGGESGAPQEARSAEGAETRGCPVFARDRSHSECEVCHGDIASCPVYGPLLARDARLRGESL